MEHFTLTLAEFEAMALCITAFRMLRNSIQSTKKSCFSPGDLFVTHSAKSCHVFITFGGGNAYEFLVFYFATQLIFHKRETYLMSNFGFCRVEHSYVSLYPVAINVETHYNCDVCFLSCTKFLQCFRHVRAGYKFLKYRAEQPTVNHIRIFSTQ